LKEEEEEEEEEEEPPRKNEYAKAFYTASRERFRRQLWRGVSVLIGVWARSAGYGSN